MKKGSLHHQFVELFSKSGIFTAGASKHMVKTDARKRGILSSSGLGSVYTIYSFGTARVYLAVWHAFANFLAAFGLRSLNEITPDHVRAYLQKKIEERVAFRTFALQVSALKKLEKALRMYFGIAKDFRAVAGEMAQHARKVLEKNYGPRAYTDPYGLLAAINDERYTLIARLQLEGGARRREATLFRARQLCGHTVDELTGKEKGRIHLEQCKGGLQRNILVTVPTYSELERAIQARGGVFRVNKECYRRSIVKAARDSGQVYHGSHGLRWVYAQQRFFQCRDHGLTNEQALKKVALEMGHRRSSITRLYLILTSW